jgi:outer membrane protein assembly factor BamB
VIPPITPFDDGGTLALDGLLARPLASAPMGEPIEVLKALLAQGVGTIRGVPEHSQLLHAAPTVSGDSVFANDGERISAWDRFTLTLRWRKRIDTPIDTTIPYFGAGVPALEDMTRVSVSEPYVVAVTGLALVGRHAPQRTLTCFDTRTGAVVWSRTATQISPLFDESVLRGAPIIDQGAVVVAAIKQSQQKRLVGISLAGVDLATGVTLWVRPLASIGALPWGTSRAGGGDESLASQGVTYRGDRLGV